MRISIFVLVTILSFISCQEKKHGDKLSFKDANRIIKESFSKIKLMKNRSDGKIYFEDTLIDNKNIFIHKPSYEYKIHLSKFPVFKNKDFVLKNLSYLLKNENISDYYSIYFFKTKNNELECNIVNYFQSIQGEPLMEPGFVNYTFVYVFINGGWRFVREEDWN